MPSTPIPFNDWEQVAAPSRPRVTAHARTSPGDTDMPALDIA